MKVGKGDYDIIVSCLTVCFEGQVKWEMRRFQQNCRKKGLGLQVIEMGNYEQSQKYCDGVQVLSVPVRTNSVTLEAIFKTWLKSAQESEKEVSIVFTEQDFEISGQFQSPFLDSLAIQTGHIPTDLSGIK